MNELRRALLAAVIGLATSAASAHGSHDNAYEVLAQPQPTAGDGKIEVVEFFWYGCEHCYRLEPVIHSWLARKPVDVEFKRIPAAGSERWNAMTRLFYSLEAMGQMDRLHSRIFDAIHKEGVRLDQPQARNRWLAANGVDPEKYSEVEKSFGVVTKVQRARDLTQAYRIDGVPTLAVAGRYVTSPGRAGGADKAFQVVDELIVRARIESRPPVGGR